MSEFLPQKRAEDARIMVGLLESLEREGPHTQRRLASDLGIALGLVNAYLKRCVKKGLLKVRQAPARTYAYSLTPEGFAEKARLTVEYLSYSFLFFRCAKAECMRLLAEASALGFRRVVLAGVSDLAEIVVICALESEVEIVAVVDAASIVTRFVGHPVLRYFDAVAGEIDAVVVTDLKTAHETHKRAVIQFGADRVLMPSLSGITQAVAG